MKVLRLEEPRALEHAIHTLQHGGTVAFPTDTVYGIGASLAAPDALRRIFELKGRDRRRPLPVLLSSPSAMAVVSDHVDPRLLELASEFWPGALTVAVPARAGLPAEVVAGDGTVGVRIPDHSIALTLAQRVGGALAVTSANLSGSPPAVKPDDIVPELAAGLDLVLDGGIARLGKASSVVALQGDTIAIIREEAVAAAAIESAWQGILARSQVAAIGKDPSMEAGR
ncbi:MAG TPA: L-threonylcarbamoyladenylate synthase [Thermomicrobiales bacterium]|nr:L-threonylcarbamoyladenylate synthase [Thermomicrobiales bacterium]